MPKRILVIEDDQPMEQVLCRIVQLEGHEPQVAQTWADFEEAMLGELPDLMLIDIALPWVNGLDLNESLEESTLFQGIPRVIVSGHSQDAYRLRAYAQGCRAFIAKPFEVEDLRETIRQVLAEAEDPSAEAAAPA
jgi:DNA-binding response OmpR family regulator